MSDIKTQKLAQTLVSQLMQGSKSGQEVSSAEDSTSILELIKGLQTELQGVDRSVSKTEAKLAEMDSGNTDPITDQARAEQMSLLDLRKALIEEITAAKADVESAKEEASFENQVGAAKNFADSNVNAFKEAIVDEKIETKQSMLENPERSKALQGSYQAQLEVAKEGVGFWKEESNFWSQEQKLGPISNKEELGELHAQVSNLEDQISNLLGTNSKDKDSLKKQLSGTKNEITALRSRS